LNADGPTVIATPVSRELRPLIPAASRILFSPHIAGLSPESGRRIMMESAENIARALAGQDPLHVVNPYYD
jgi:phosphoglycerate dehydrogenase-like enzyme